MANQKDIEKWLLKQVEDIREEILVDLPDYIVKTTKTHFNRAIKELPASDDFISVFQMRKDKDSAYVECGGTQVLFMEFGAGVAHYYDRGVAMTTTMAENDNHELIEFAQRPSGIYDIGGYGHHRGNNDSWIFYDTEFIQDNGRNHTHLIGRTSEHYVYRTGGIRPVRALYSAVSSGVKKLALRKLKKKK